jgi:hypothetical protein
MKPANFPMISATARLDPRQYRFRSSLNSREYAIEDWAQALESIRFCDGLT